MNNSLRIGIFLGYGPDVILNKEGLGRYLGDVVSLLSCNHHVTIATPKWLVDSVRQLLNDMSIDAENISFISTNRSPILWKIYTRLKSARKRTHTKIDFTRSIEFLLNTALSITQSLPFFLLSCLMLFPAVIILVPALLLYLIIRGLRSLFWFLSHIGMSKLKSTAKSILDRTDYSWSSLRLYAFSRMLSMERNGLVRLINRNDSVDIWFSPSAFWPEFNLITRPHVVNVPDLVTKEFPLGWGTYPSVIHSSEEIASTIKNAPYYIVYSDYIKNKLLIQKYGVNPERIYVIKHIPHDLSKYITFNNRIMRTFNNSADFTISFCNTITQSLRPSLSDIVDYMSGFKLKDVDFILYPSQWRPHKNILNLIYAYEKLLRDRYVQVKLVLTCDLSHSELYEYIKKNRLEYDVISFPGISTQQLAALYHMAKLVVTPTLYEGGFPFTFCEGLSVGTPSVMSDIPQVREELDYNAFKDVLFDPYDCDDICNKIEYALQNLDTIFQREKAVYDCMIENHNREITKHRYMSAFKEVLYDVSQKTASGGSATYEKL